MPRFFELRLVKNNAITATIGDLVFQPLAFPANKTKMPTDYVVQFGCKTYRIYRGKINDPDFYCEVQGQRIAVNCPIPPNKTVPKRV